VASDGQFAKKAHRPRHIGGRFSNGWDTQLGDLKCQAETQLFTALDVRSRILQFSTNLWTEFCHL